MSVVGSKIVRFGVAVEGFCNFVIVLAAILLLVL